MGLAKNLVLLAEQESEVIALDEAQKIQAALETILEAGQDDEVKAANLLLCGVSDAIFEITCLAIDKKDIEDGVSQN